MSNKKGMDIDNMNIGKEPDYSETENEAYFRDLFDSDGVEIPESLSAENMKMKLEEHDATKSETEAGPEPAAEAEATAVQAAEAEKPAVAESEAEAPEVKPVKVNVKKHSWMKPLGMIAAAAACFFLVLMPVLNSQKTDPLDSLSSEDYGLTTFKSYKEINKMIDDMTGSSGMYRKGVDMAVEDSAESGDLVMNDGAAMAPKGAMAAPGNSDGTAQSHSDTYIQVKGVDEADRVKCDDNYLYYISSDGERIYICSADQGKSKRVSAIKAGKGKMFTDMFLDADRLVTISGGYWGVSETFVTVYDITDRKAPKKAASYVQSGSPVSQRMVDGIVYLVTDKYADGHEIPYCGDAKKSKKMQPEDICCVPNPVAPEYTVIGAVDTRSGKELSHVTKAVLGGSQDIYSNGENLYVAGRTYIKNKKEKPEAVRNEEDSEMIDRIYPYYQGTPATVIIKIRMADGKIKLEKTGAVKGTIDDQFSMDEKDGDFRIATTSLNDEGDEINNLFVLNSDLKLIGKVSGFAKGESIKAVRYFKDKAYVITYEETDPLFVIDLSNSRKPKIEGEVKIDGFSTLLVPLSEDRLLGIGYGVEEVETWQEVSGLKFVIFDVSDPSKPKVVTTTTMEGVFSDVQDDHRGLVVLGEGGEARFVLPCWEEYEEYEVDDDVEVYDDAEDDYDEDEEGNDADGEDVDDAGDEEEGDTVDPQEPDEDADEPSDSDDSVDDDGFRGGALELTAADDKINIIDYHKTEEAVSRCPVIKDYIYAICDNDEVVSFKLK